LDSKKKDPITKKKNLKYVKVPNKYFNGSLDKILDSIKIKKNIIEKKMKIFKLLITSLLNLIDKNKP